MPDSTERNYIGIGCNVFVLKNGKILLGKRKNCYGEGSWGLPGGHLEKFELLSDAAQRELKEETGIKAENLTFVNLTNHILKEDNQHYIQVGFLAEGMLLSESKIMEPNKCEEWRWFNLEELPNNIFVGHIKQIKSFISKNCFSE